MGLALQKPCRPFAKTTDLRPYHAWGSTSVAGYADHTFQFGRTPEVRSFLIPSIDGHGLVEPVMRSGGRAEWLLWDIW